VIDLSKLGDLKLVERIKLKAIMDELGITQSDYFDQARVPRAGKLLGAKRVISGQLSQPEGDELKLESGVIDVVDGFVEYPDNVEGQLGQFFRLEKELAANILENLGYPLTPELRAELEKLPTDSFLAFLSYCLGLEYVDQGMYALAEAQFGNWIFRRVIYDEQIQQNIVWHIRHLHDYVLPASGGAGGFWAAAHGRDEVHLSKLDPYG
jgi:uncharacterized protein (DUF2164 family)